MEKINQQKFLTSISTQLTTSEELKQSRSNPSDDAKRYNNEVFKRVIAICPAWKQAFSTADAAKDARREWLIGFSDAENITGDAIESALKCLRDKGSPFMPTIGEFLVWCEESYLPAGTLSGTDSYAEWLEFDMGKRDISELSRPTYHTMSIIYGSGRKGHLTGSKPAESEKYWIERYKATLEKMKAGKALKEVPVAAHKLEHIRQPSKRSTMMDAMKAMRKGL